MYGLSPDGQPAIPSLPGLKLYQMDIGNQNFYSAPVSSMASSEQIQQRRQLIDQLLATNPDGFAQQALKQARARLSGGLARN
jgi:hypothetical protein